MGASGAMSQLASFINDQGGRRRGKTASLLPQGALCGDEAGQNQAAPFSLRSCCLNNSYGHAKRARNTQEKRSSKDPLWVILPNTQCM